MPITRRMKAEWETQRAVLMAFPHTQSDWVDYIQEARENFLHIIAHIVRFEDIIVCVDPRDTEGKKILEKLQKSQNKFQIQIVEVRSNDTWARDFGPISIQDGKVLKMLDFTFNGWGLKFEATDDNQINARLLKAGVFKHEMQSLPFVLEGGSIDTDGQGRILTNTQCLLSPHRNPYLSQFQIEQTLKNTLGAEEVLWLHSGYLQGDDTDSHIDTLARFLNPTTIAYVKCEDKNDEHYEELEKMEAELLELKTPAGKPYNLIALPLPDAKYANNGGDGAFSERLPATYANFLFINNALLVPTYGDKKDNQALEILQSQCLDREVIGIDCSTLIRQHGSLHCVTMQIY
ncbi:agmatine deiminase family protein [Helicobacter sp. 11S02596-1]|uniref:agmatine deiminase family protein n=1 Tax=Helicobacter sp. 11S02596-1 TaxID=1476194 RepID=UPI000BD281B8|nr:agmatine deiminase family protein [Helicobacter sp. 11S02596-1]PAF41430.1 agmatine deiminase [Helicobacter sp. 11S02596-1]